MKHFKKTKIKLAVSDVVFETASYPRDGPSTATREQYADSMRAGSEFPPIEVDANGKVLLDGYHRWKAHEDIGTSEIEVLAVDLNETPRLLYAAECNSRHGDRLQSSEQEAVAVEMAQQDVGQKVIADAMGVSIGTVNAWVKHITEQKKRRRDAKTWWINQLGWTQEEIATTYDMPQRTVSDSLAKISDLKTSLKSQAGRGRSYAEIAEAEDVPIKLVDVLLLDGKDDTERMKAMQLKVAPYDVWSFTGCDPRFGEDWPGRIPGQVVLHTLYFFTKPGDAVIDPMAGSGTTVDACAYLGRKVYGYDLAPCEGRDDIIKHDMADGWPERTKKASLLFWDPPYFKKKDAQYADGSISRLDRKAYLEFFERSVATLRETCKGQLAFICSDYDEDGQDIFFWDYVNLFQKVGWQPVRRIQVPLTTQSVHPDIVNRFREERRLARLGRDLLILKRKRK